MYGAYPPVEVVQGRSRVGYFFGFIVGGIAIAVGWSALLFWVAGTYGQVWSSRDFVAITELQGVGNIVLVLFVVLWFLLVPMPLGRTEVSPLGIRVSYGL